MAGESAIGHLTSVAFEAIMPSRRQRRVSELIHRELSMLLMLDARDPRLAGVTITGVDITSDLMVARVFFTVLAEGDEKVSEAQAGLERATGFLRTQLAARVQLRVMPHLVFELDKSTAYGRRIDALLDGLAGDSPRSEAEWDERDNPIPDEQERD
jgi:ribosome-binding factor A